MSLQMPMFLEVDSGIIQTCRIRAFKRLDLWNAKIQCGFIFEDIIIKVDYEISQRN